MQTRRGPGEVVQKGPAATAGALHRFSFSFPILSARRPAACCYWPVPNKLALAVLPGVAETESDATLAPVAVGENVTATVQVAPAAKVLTQVLPPIAYWPAFMPPSVVESVPEARPPTLVAVNTTEALVVPLVTIPKSRVHGESVSAAAAHTPPTQVMPAAQALPHIPQLLESVCVSTQALLQTDVAVGGQAHVPALQLPPVGQAARQAPQLFRSVVMSISQPSAAWPLQSLNAVEQLTMRHAPAVQLADAFCRAQGTPVSGAN